MKKILSFLLCVLLVMVMFAGCGKNQESYTPTGDGLASDDPTRPTNPALTEDELSLPFYPNRSLNPYECADYTNRTLMGLVYQGLFAVDADYRVYPVLCDTYTVSRDMKTYTFHIAEATFSDGSPLTAGDVAASLKAAKKSGFYSGRFGYVESITEEGDAVTIELDTAYENFPLLLDVPIVKKAEVSAKRPLGTGPYLYEGIADSWWLRRRTDWWCAADTPVTTEYITLVEAYSSAQLRDEFEFSGLGLVTADPGSDRYVDFHGDYELWDSETGIFMYLACNRESPVFANDGIRAALTYAIDRSGIVEQYYRGFAYAAVLPASPQSPYYDAKLAQSYGYAPEKLTQAVAAATELESKTVTLLVNTDDGVRLRAARAIVQSLNACGLKVLLSELGTDAYRTALEEGKYDLYLGQTKLSANMDLSAFFHKEGTLNYGGMQDTSLAALCRDALANTGNYYTLHQEILEDGQLCPILFRSHAIYAQRGQFSGLTPSRDNAFFYQIGRTMADALTEEVTEPEQ